MSTGGAQGTVGVRCDVCGGRHVHELAGSVEFPGRQIVACRSCGLMFLAPTPSAADLGAYYREAYRRGRGERLDWKYRLGMRLRARMQCRYLLAQGAGVQAAAGPLLLDVGCGAGFLLHELIRRGWRGVGIEPDAAFAEWGRRRFGVDIVTGTFPDATPTGIRADLIAFSHTLEHVPSAVGTLRAARQRLAPGGLVYVEVPRVTAAAARAFAPRSPHVYHFQAPTLRRALEAAGLQVRTLVGTAPRFRWLPAQVLARQRTAAPQGAVARSFERVQRSRGRLWWRALRWSYFRAQDSAAAALQAWLLLSRQDATTVLQDAAHPDVTVLRALACLP